MSITLVAVGNGGYNLASDIKNANLFTDAKLIVCDTDDQELANNASQADASFRLDEIRKAKSNLAGLVEDIISQVTDAILICATLGGQTGSIYAPLIALAAILKGKFVCSAFSMPFDFEGVCKIKQAETAKMQLITASNFAIQQNNEMLKGIDNTDIANMNTPIIEAIKTAISSYSFIELASANNKEIQEIIPENYRKQKEKPLIWFRSDCYRGISDKGRKEVFDSFL